MVVDPGLPAHRDTLPFSMRRDVLVFQTEPLTEDVEITGPITVTFWGDAVSNFASIGGAPLSTV